MTNFWMNALQYIGEAMDIHNLDRESGKIFITEASSEVGQRITSQLVNTGYAHVRVGKTMSNTNKLHGDMDHIEGTELVHFDWDREETYAHALSGVKSVIISIPYKRHWYKHFSAFIKACKKANVKRYVKISFYLSQIPGTRQIPFVKHHTNCDEMLRNMIIPDEENVSQMSYTIIAASHFMSNPTSYYSTKLSSSTDVTSSTILLNASKNRAANYISPNDVAKAVTNVVLLPRDHYNRVYMILGPESITNVDLAALMSLYFGKIIKCIDCINITDYRDKFMEKNRKTPTWRIKDRVALQQVIASGFEEYIANVIHNDFFRICGQAPETFYDYLTYRINGTVMESSGAELDAV